MSLWALRRDGERRDEVVGQALRVAAEMPVEAPRVVLDGVFLPGAVGHALAARVRPGERRFDAVRRVVGEREADGAGRRDRQQVRVAQAVRADLLLHLGRQARREVAARQVEIGIEQREGAAFLREFDAREIGAVAHELGDACRHRARLDRVVAQLQHDQRVAEAGEAESDAALRGGFGLLLGQRPARDVEHVVEHAHGDVDHAAEAVEVERGVRWPNGSRTSVVRLIEPRSQQPYGGSGCSAHGFVLSIVSQ
jgi:hypothetical protein